MINKGWIDMWREDVKKELKLLKKIKPCFRSQDTKERIYKLECDLYYYQ